ncbi:DUF418 domain-containing protein [Shigella flexneri]
MLIWCRIDAQWRLKGVFSLRHYRRTGFVLVAIGVMMNLPAIALQWRLDLAYRRRAFTSDAAELSAPFQAIGYASPLMVSRPGSAALSWCLRSPALGRMALTNVVIGNADSVPRFLPPRFVYAISTAWSCWRLLFRYGWRISFFCYLAASLPPGAVEWLGVS